MPDTPDASPPPDGGYGWICVAACFLLNFSTWGAVASYGVYLSYYLTTNRFADASPLDFAFVGGFNFAFAMLVAPFVTSLTRRRGKYISMSIGIALQTTGYISAGFATRLWQLYLTHGVLVGVGIGFIYIPSLPILSQWFEARRSLANGLSSSGSGFGGALLAWVTGAIIDALGLRWALCITGVVTFALTTIATAVLRDRNRYIKPPQLALDLTLLARYDVLLLLAWSFISMLGYIVLLFSLSDFALSIGLLSQRATDVVGLLNIGTAIGRPLIGILSDKSSRLHVAGALTLVFSEVIALKLKRPESSRSYLYPQLFVALSYLAASGIMLELLRVKRRERRANEAQAAQMSITQESARE
ncbi:hypothetical protein LTR62_003332 [Meristemomyces frigidus]|uniref:Major facilitator superfamily (MFS) profile domain-containing protein n=1 Tax=Meristemomyces frigidus TaxID=1508187 RepID=A0AAN7YKU6_9PEZI|nr:hypothetical protein LTR62_003332 [Meristemomyces frigidus]